MMRAARPAVGLACNADVRLRYIDDADVRRLEQVCDFRFHAFLGSADLENPAPRDAAAESELAGFARGLDALVVGHGAPYVSAEVLAETALTFLGELEGDRRGQRFDVAAANARSVCVVDTSHASSWPTAEWALGLALIGRRNAGALFRRMVAHEQTFFPSAERSGPGYERAELSGKTVGMIGFGHIARRLTELLGPFDVTIRAYDPYATRDVPGVDFGELPWVLAGDVIFVLVPETSRTVGLLGAEELAQIPAGSVLVNVARGKVIDSDALLARLREGDIIGCLDVFDPEPLPVDSPLLDLPNVFCTPHIAGVTEESRRRFFSLMVDELLRHFSGTKPLWQLTPKIIHLRA